MGYTEILPNQPSYNKGEGVFLNSDNLKYCLDDNNEVTLMIDVSKPENFTLLI